MYEIRTQNYLKPRRIKIDDFEVTMKPLGAGSELAFKQSQRRMMFLERKIDSDTITEAELDAYDGLEQKTISYFLSVLKDDTEDNRHVKAWLESTPFEIVQLAFQDMQTQMIENDKLKQEDGDAGEQTKEEVSTAKA